MVIFVYIMFLFVVIFVFVVLIFIMFLFMVIFVYITFIFVVIFVFAVLIFKFFLIAFFIIINILVYYRSWDTWGTTIPLFATRSNWSRAPWLSCITFNSRCSGCSFSSCFTNRSSASWNSWFSRHTTRAHWAHRTDDRFSRGASFTFTSWDSRLPWFSWAWDWNLNVEDFL